VLVERRERHGTEQSARNSEVIHAGMYYPTGSLKARLCVEGSRRLYEFCVRHDVPHRRIGKLITAVEERELGPLEALLARGLANGVELRAVGPAEVAGMEPDVRSVGALFSPHTGIVSAHGLMDALLALAREGGATVQLRAEVTALERTQGGWRVTCGRGASAESFTSEVIVNAAGLGSDEVAALAGIDVDASGYRQHYCKGDYFAVAPRKAGLVRRLVYPVPGQVSLGVHAVVGLDGRLRFGPDAEYLEGREPRYDVDERKRAAFGQAVRRLVPAIADEDLTPDTAGIRSKLQRAGEPMRDFVIADESARGMPGLVNLVGIESPGLTSCLAIADEVARLLGVP
jgi:L-2-hydroxyglutarate oxidase LhgO